MITLMTMWYNEAFIAPFFLDHYSPMVDRIHIVIDDATNDNTLDIIKRYKNVTTEMFHFPELFDDELKVNKFNELYKTITYDGYVILVDSDEFILPAITGPQTPALLGSRDVHFVHFWQIYKHKTEGDIVSGIPLQHQRRHGCADMRYIKPVIVKTNLPGVWIPGNHQFWLNGTPVSYVPGEEFYGAHWKIIDVKETINRMVNNRCARQGRRNKETGRSYQFNGVTPVSIMDEYDKHKNDLRVL